MPPKSKTDENLIKRRLAQKICKRRRYAEIKNDPELLEIERKKRRERYQRQKEANKKETSKEKSSRAIREQRKKWKENSKRYRQMKKEGKKKKEPPFDVIHIQAVADADDENSSNRNDIKADDPLPHCPQIQLAVRKMRYIELKKRKQLMRIIAAYKRKNKTLNKQIQRLKNKLGEIKKNAGTTPHKPESESNRNISETETNLIKHLQKFYTEDTNSVISACKKEFITRNKVREQKRYLCLPLKDLHKKFISETNLRVSYTFFCKNRPFWVLFPKNANRETCQCSVHVNIELLISALNKASIIKEKNYEQVLSTLCCNSRNINCLQRSCDVCRSNHIDYNNTNEKRELIYFQWQKVTKDVILKNGRKKKQVLTEKTKISSSVSEAIAKTEQDLIQFLEHTYKMMGQYKTIQNLKENMNIQEVLLHVDFSENYSLKFAEEVQAFHFGASRQQVCLHTSIIYTHSFKTGLVTPTSMCTLSDCLRHDAAAVWAHLVPLIEQAMTLNPLIDTIHFLSDSPSSQYRNKSMFNIISQIHKDFPQINSITWNYSESGHGKGAPDGVGATLKRTADRMVLYGEDVGTFNQFYDLIKRCIENNQLNIIVNKVEEKDIIQKSNLVPHNIKPFKGTLSVHQVLWNKSQTRTITLRKMSCFECAASQTCLHGKHLGQFDIPVLQKVQILSDITLKATNIAEFQPKPSTSKDQKYLFN